MTPLAASLVGYGLGVLTALIVAAIWMIVRGGQDVRDSDDRRRADRLTKGRGGW
jgi:hypothetical protein